MTYATLDAMLAARAHQRRRADLRAALLGAVVLVAAVGLWYAALALWGAAR